MWAIAISDVKPLRKRKDAGGSRSRKGGSKISIGVKREAAEIRSGAGLDRRSDERLRRGKMDIEARLDLHGMRLAAAEKALVSFMTASVEQGRRNVLVITGKGEGRGAARAEQWWESQAGGLRKSLPEWLSKKPLSDIVLRFYPAQRKDGGSGAWYVLLRRKKGAQR